MSLTHKFGIIDAINEKNTKNMHQKSINVFQLKMKQ